MHKPKKRFGQNFLHDQNVLTQIISSLGPQPQDTIVEIGPGQGAVTKLLLEKVKHITAIEIDRDLIGLLTSTFSKEQLTLISQDVLKVDLCDEKIPKPIQGGQLRLVGNLPYNISTPLLFHLFSQIDVIQDMHFMLQKEVAERLAASAGSSQYGRLSVMSQYYCDAEILFLIGPDSFDPPPKVDSAFIRLTPKKTRLSVEDFALFQNIVLDAFNQRRKTISNGLKKYMSPEDWEAVQMDAKKRPQTLCVEEFVKISNYVALRRNSTQQGNSDV